MFRNLATLILYISILFFNVTIPKPVILLYTFFIFLGDSYAYFPKKIQKKIQKIWFFFENYGNIGYNIEFMPIILLSIFIFFRSL
jgi:hypothetical protein